MGIDDIKTDDGTAITGNEPNNVISVADYNESPISVDNKSVLTDAGIIGFDKLGNAIDKDNKVILASDKYDKADFNSLSKTDFISKYFNNVSETDTFKESDIVAGLELTIDNIDYKIDANGNAIGVNGTTITKADLLKLMEVGTAPNTPKDLITQVSEFDGYDLQDESGNILTFDSTPEGIAKRTKFIVDSEVTKHSAIAVNSFLNSMPELNTAYNYLKVNGSLNGFGNYIDYSKVTIDKDDKAQQRELVISDIMGLGKSRQEAEDYTRFVESTGKLYDNSDLVLKNKQAAQIKEIETANIKQKEYEEDQKRDWDNIQSTVKSVITDGKLLNYKLPEVFKVKDVNGAIKQVPRSEFEKYLFAPVSKEGFTQVQLDRQARAKSLDNLIFDDLLLFLNMDNNQLILNNKEDSRIKTIIKRKTESVQSHSIKFKAKVSPIDDIK